MAETITTEKVAEAERILTEEIISQCQAGAVQCPECGAMIDHLRCRSRQDTVRVVRLDENDQLEWACLYDIQPAELEEFECPECGEVLFRFPRSYQVDEPQQVARFLRGGNAD